METAIKRAAQVLPSKRQVEWNCMEFYGFVHFGLYTFGPDEEGKMGAERQIFYLQFPDFSFPLKLIA